MIILIIYLTCVKIGHYEIKIFFQKKSCAEIWSLRNSLSGEKAYCVWVRMAKSSLRKSIKSSILLPFIFLFFIKSLKAFTSHLQAVLSPVRVFILFTFLIQRWDKKGGTFHEGGTKRQNTYYDWALSIFCLFMCKKGGTFLFHSFFDFFYIKIRSDFNL